MPCFSPELTFYKHAITFLRDLEPQWLFFAGVTVMSFDRLLKYIPTWFWICNESSAGVPSHHRGRTAKHKGQGKSVFVYKVAPAKISHLKSAGSWYFLFFLNQCLHSDEQSRMKPKCLSCNRHPEGRTSESKKTMLHFKYWILWQVLGACVWMWDLICNQETATYQSGW